MKKLKMKKAKRVSLSAALLLLLTVLSLALAETDLSILFKQGCALAFNTENVTLSGKAEFFLDGKSFKQVEAGISKDGLDSLWNINVFTPLHDGSTRHSGYSVLGKDGVAWFHDFDTEYYGDCGVDPSRSVIRSGILKEAFTAAGTVIANVGSLLSPGTVSSENAEDGSLRVHVQADENSIPEAIQVFLPEMLSSVSWELGYGSPGMFVGNDWEPVPQVIYEDYDILFACTYEQMYGEPLPEDFWERIQKNDQEDAPETEALFTVMDKIGETEQQAWLTGKPYSVILTDGSIVTFDTEEEYLHLSANIPLIFDNRDAAFRAYYQEVTGEQLSREAESVVFGPISDPDLEQAYLEMLNGMYEKYLSAAREVPDALGVHIYADGMAEALTQPDQLRAARERFTPFQSLMYLMQQIRFKKVDFVFTSDAQDRLTGVNGEAVFLVTVEGDILHELTVKLDCSASGYGLTDLSSLTPETALGVPDFESWWLANMENDFEPEEEPLPAYGSMVLFNGQKYLLTDPGFNSSYDY